MNEREAFKLGLYYLHHFPRPLNPKYLESGQDKYTSNKITSVIKLKLLKCKSIMRKLSTKGCTTIAQ